MATADDIAVVRLNVDEPTDTMYSDSVIAGLIDSGSVASASATIWRWKAASYAKLVNVSEAGASHSNSDLSKNALAMAAKFAAEVAVVVPASDRPVIRQIER